MKKKYKVLVTSRSFAKKTEIPLKLLKEAFCDVVVRRGPLNKEEMAEAIQDADAAIIGSDKIDRETLRYAKKLKVISTHGVGTDGVDIEAADSEGIIFANVPGTNSESVADLAIGLMICLARNIVTAHNKTIEGTWEAFSGTSVYGKSLGILGLGSIGKELVKRAAGFHMRIRAFDVVQDSDFAEKWNIEYSPVDAILRESDFLSIHLPLNSQTRGSLNSEKLKMMKKTAYVVNLSRGGIIDEKDLAEALNLGIIAGAATDVFEKEPPEKNNILFQCRNMIVTPHIGGRVEEAVVETSVRAAKNIIHGLKGETDKIAIVNNPLRLKTGKDI